MFCVAFETMVKRVAEKSPDLATGEGEVVKPRGRGRPKKETKVLQPIAEDKVSKPAVSFGSPPPNAVGNGGGTGTSASPITPAQGMSRGSHERVPVFSCAYDFRDADVVFVS